MPSPCPLLLSASLPRTASSPTRPPSLSSKHKHDSGAREAEADSPRDGGRRITSIRTMEEKGRGTRLGVLKVVVAQGNNLAIRDFTSSDPYVVVRLADWNAKTKVINSCLNPIWNEEMVFSIKEPVGVIKFEVFDRDRFKYDDKMGHAFLDLQPIAAATKLRRALQITAGESKLRKVAPATDNCLLSDSFVTYADGEVMLDARLRLRDVESGELFVTIKWIEADAK